MKQSNRIKVDAVMLKAWAVAPSSVRTLLISSLLMNLGFFALIPYLTLYLTGSFYWSLGLTGVLLGVRQFSQQGFTFIGGLVADRFGCKQTLIAGVLLRGIGFASFAFCSEVGHFFVAAIIAGFGGALFEPAFQAAFARETPQEHRKLLFSFKNIVGNIGMVSSTLVGSALSSVDFLYLSFVSGGIYVFIAGLVYRGLPHLEVEFTRSHVLQEMRTIVRDKPFVMYTIILIGYYYLFMQLFLTIPKLAETVTGSSKGVAYVYGTVSLSVIVLQFTITRWLQRYENRFRIIGMGTFVMGTGLVLFVFADQLWILLAGAFLFALGTMMAGPLMIDVVPTFAAKKLLASYYGFNGYSLALGGMLSTMLGGWFYDLGEHWGMASLPWLVCGAVAVVSASFLFKFKDDRASSRTSGTL